MLSPELKSQWIAALRSGEYAQTVGQLYRENDGCDYVAGYCCLGVLAAIAGEIPDNIRNYAPSAYHKLAGLSEVSLDYRNKLMDMNDEGEHNFPQIADFIKRHSDI